MTYQNYGLVFVDSDMNEVSLTLSTGGTVRVMLRMILNSGGQVYRIIGISAGHMTTELSPLDFS